MLVALRPDFGPAGLPPLPIIHNAELRQQALTHRSYASRPAHVFEDRLDDPSPDNEMLEHLGDTVLNLVVTQMLREMYPCLRVGPATKLRALLVGNATLASLTMQYRIQDRLILHPAQAITLRASPKIQADVFESYVGALYTDQGLEVVRAWIYPLLEPYAIEGYSIVRAQHGLPPLEPAIRPTVTASSTSSSSMTSPALTPPSTPQKPAHTSGYITPPSPRQAEGGYLPLFNQHMAQQDKNIEWVFTTASTTAEPGATRGNPIRIDVKAVRRTAKTTPVWHVKAMLDGKCIGRGRGQTKKAAKNDAAKRALIEMNVDFSEPTPVNDDWSMT
ncbi:ribonuclease III [Punctularia strigosozonata HHB-11173 SS5]|uniref:ribonuclease III n=1 Tax=Punctularia strigosozonata (strain HHB-11173) TaxID=741275 RepID=UPI000441811B|nr:ribonuclease III [Punctularia strigosozonata HHB-11173 SS5]EIN10970.1 ribonuclease III [Punctularia strigosozonata HHB-11173 SS5]